MENRRDIARAIRRLIVFQIKLFADAFRDFLLSPLSTIAVIIDLILGLEDERSWYRRMMRYGVESDRFINLFNQFSSEQTIDELLRRASGRSKRADGD